MIVTSIFAWPPYSWRMRVQARLIAGFARLVGAVVERA